MAAEIRPFSESSGKMQLISKLEGHQDVVNMAFILHGEDGVISISDDKYKNLIYINLYFINAIVI